jgi:hypothetical protein
MAASTGLAWRRERQSIPSISSEGDQRSALVRRNALDNRVAKSNRDGQNYLGVKLFATANVPRSPVSRVIFWPA